MSDSGSNRKKVVAIGVVAVVGVAAGVWAFTSSRAGEKKSLLPEELSVASIKSMASEDPGKIREAMERADLTEEQQRELRRNAMEAFESMVDERVNEYFAAAEGDRQAILDKHIDELQARRKEWEQRRKEWEARREKEKAEAKDDKKEEERERPDWRSRMASMTRQERKEQTESSDPDKMAQRFAYRSAMMERAKARGIEMRGPGMGGFGMGGGRGMGGPGGGPGGGGPGDRGRGGSGGRGGRGGG